MMTRQQRVLAFGVSVAILLASLGWFAVKPTISSIDSDSRPQPGAQVSEQQRLHYLALRDLKETQDEIAKMKAHGIGMHGASGTIPGY